MPVLPCMAFFILAVNYLTFFLSYRAFLSFKIIGFAVFFVFSAYPIIFQKKKLTKN